MANILYPAPLKVGSKIAICSLSAGLKEKFHARLDIVINGLKNRGYDVVEGEFLRQNKPREQLNAKAHAQQLMGFLLDEEIDAIMPPMGGELAMEILPLLDFNAIKQAKPKWLVGFSDVSTIACALTAKCQWATLHSANLMQLHPDEKIRIAYKYSKPLLTKRVVNLSKGLPLYIKKTSLATRKTQMNY